MLDHCDALAQRLVCCGHKTRYPGIPKVDLVKIWKGTAWANKFGRTFCNLILIPAVATFTSDVLLLLALYRPWFTIIFLSLCGTIIAAVMWITAFILMFLTLSGFINYLHMFSALMMAFFHCWLAYTPLRLEWDPDYDSFMRMFKRLRRNQWRMLNDE